MADQLAVQIRNLSKRIGSKTIIDNLSLDIPKGEVFGFLGPNGAGKTTTIRMMVGLISITQGQVLIGGVDVQKNFSEAMRQLGCIVENPELYKFLTGYQNLVQMARMSPGVDKARIAEVAQLVGLHNRLHDKVKTYSLGMRQRLGLAQALLHKPSVLILDEPTNGLDPAGIRELRDHLRHLAKEEGMSVIVSSHLLSEMELMCDRVAVIQHGKLIHVQRMRELMASQTAEQLTSFEVDDAPAARAILELLCGPVVSANAEVADVIDVTIKRERIPALIKALVDGEIEVYGVRTQIRTLEETFLEMTGDGVIV